VISPIRAMRPARQASTALSPSAMSIPVESPTPSAQDSFDLAEALVQENLVGEPSTDSGATSPKPAQEEPAQDEIAEVNAPASATLSKARKMKSIRIKSPQRPFRTSGRFMAPTASSDRKSSGRENSRDAASRGSTPGSSSPSQCRNASLRLARIKKSISATRADMTPPLTMRPFEYPPLTSSRPVHAPTEQPRSQDSGDAEKKSTVRLRAKKSFRKLFHKSEGTSTDNVAISSEPKLSSIANSGRTLAKRISKNFSKVHVSDVPAVPESQLQSLQEALASPDQDSSHVAVSDSVFLPHETAATVKQILASIGSMSVKSPESVRSLEIAEVCLHIKPKLIFMLIGDDGLVCCPSCRISEGQSGRI
jgi:hypothetical protein